MGGMISLPEIYSQLEKETCVNTRLNKQRESIYLTSQTYRHTIESIPFEISSSKMNYDKKFPVRLRKEPFIKRDPVSKAQTILLQYRRSMDFLWIQRRELRGKTIKA